MVGSAKPVTVIAALAGTHLILEEADRRIRDAFVASEQVDAQPTLRCAFA